MNSKLHLDKNFINSWLVSCNLVINLSNYGKLLQVEYKMLHEAVDNNKRWSKETKSLAHELIERL